MKISLPKSLSDQLKEDYIGLKEILVGKGYIISELPPEKQADNENGEAYSLAYPIQGLLKYHGMANTEHRTAFFPSISLNNDSVFTVTYLKFDKDYDLDRFFLNGTELKGNKFYRIQYQLNYIRKFSSINSNALVISRNIRKKDNQIAIGKGLGTSASGGAAISRAAFSVLYNTRDYSENETLLSVSSRYLAGSAARSSTGGISIWMNHPGIDTSESFSIRLDRKTDTKFIEDIDLITVSIPLKIQTEIAHKLAPKSIFFNEWLRNRKTYTLDFINALGKHDFRRIGELTEYDTQCLHAIIMTGTPEERLIVWAPTTLKIMNLTECMRERGIPVYYSIDTGPSVVLMTQSNYTSEIIEELNAIGNNIDIMVGKIGGESRIIEPDSPESQLLNEDLNRWS